MISEWGGTESCVIKAVQVMQNKAARCLTKKCCFTPTSVLLQQCNWLNIRQLIFYHTVLQVWRVKSAERPRYINGKLQAAVTRSAVDGTLRVPQVERSVSGKSFMVRAAVMWNTIPPNLSTIKQQQTFKKNLKIWIKQNIEIG